MELIKQMEAVISELETLRQSGEVALPFALAQRSVELASHARLAALRSDRSLALAREIEALLGPKVYHRLAEPLRSTHDPDSQWSGAQLWDWIARMGYSVAQAAHALGVKKGTLESYRPSRCIPQPVTRMAQELESAAARAHPWHLLSQEKAKPVQYKTWLKQWRVRQGLTQAELANMLGCCAGTIGNMENAKTPIPDSIRLALDAIENQKRAGQQHE